MHKILQSFVVHAGAPLLLFQFQQVDWQLDPTFTVSKLLIAVDTTISS